MCYPSKAIAVLYCSFVCSSSLLVANQALNTYSMVSASLATYFYQVDPWLIQAYRFPASFTNFGLILTNSDLRVFAGPVSKRLSLVTAGAFLLVIPGFISLSKTARTTSAASYSPCNVSFHTSTTESQPLLGPNTLETQHKPYEDRKAAKIYKVYLLYETGSRNIDLLLSMIPEPSHDLSLPRERIVEVLYFEFYHHYHHHFLVRPIWPQKT